MEPTSASPGPTASSREENRRHLPDLRPCGARPEAVLVVLILAIAIWVAHFSLSFHLGLYEDDWFFIGRQMGLSWAGIVDRAVADLRGWPQGRPVGYAGVAVLAFLGNQVGGLEGIYLIAFALHLMNTFLIYTIVHRSLSSGPSFCAALGFCLFPSITNTPLLHAQLISGLTRFFLLFATWLYLRGSRVVAYAVSIGSLLTYESAFLPFFAVPLLHVSPMPKLRRELLKHWAILLAIGASLFWVRAQMGEEKTSAVLGNGFLETLKRVAIAMYAGSLTTLRLSVMRLVTVFRDADHEVVLVVIPMVLGLTLVLYFLKVGRSDKLVVCPLSFTNRWFQFQGKLTVDEASAAAFRLAFCGVVMLVMAYGLAISEYYYPPVIEAGRLTGTHLAAAVGFALLCGAISALVLDLGISLGIRFGAVLALACYFSGLTGFHYLVQQDFRKSWAIQRSFWTSVLERCPDLANGTILIYEEEAQPTRYIETNSWGDPLVLSELFDFPTAWKQPPRLFPVAKTWMADVAASDDKLFLRPPAPWPPEILPKNNVILLKAAPGGGLRRVTGTIAVGSEELPLKPLGQSTISLCQRGALYRYVVQR